MNQVVQEKLDTYFSKCTPRTYAKGDIIILAGDDPKGVSLLVSGLVEQYDITPEGNKLTVNVFKPSAFFPMSWAINKTPNTYFYAALTETTLRQADAEQTVLFLRTNPDVMFDLLARVYKGSDALLRRIVLATSGIASSRLIFELLVEAYRFGTDIDSTHVRITMQQSALAARSGLARETVSRELHKLEQAAFITRVPEGIIIDMHSIERKLDITI
jgi:CRP-like cAMP-binding protein